MQNKPVVDGMAEKNLTATPAKKVLIIDDDPGVLTLLKRTLALPGITVYTAMNGTEGLPLLFRVHPDLVLLDLLMPELDGWQTLAAIRDLTDIPIIIISALNDSEEMVQLLEDGAVDYITKPFLPSVVVAKVKALLRQTTPAPSKQANIYSDGYLTLERTQQLVYIDAKPVRLTRTERRLLFYLFERAGEICAFEEILENIWGWSYRESTQYVHVYISRLRRKIEPDPEHPRYLLTEHHIGYRFNRHNAAAIDSAT